MIFGGLGDDTITGGLGADIIIGDQGRVHYGTGDDLVRLGGGGPGDRVNPVAQPITRIFNQDDDTETGTDTNVFSNDGMVTDLGGSDTVHGLAGDDIILGGQDNDGTDTTRPVIDGSEVLGDALHGDAGEDVVIGDRGKLEFMVLANPGVVLSRIETERIHVGGSDIITGGTQDDLLIGGADGDFMDGGLGRDLVFGDNVILERRLASDPLPARDPRVRQLNASQIYAPDGSLDLDLSTPFADPRHEGAPWAELTITELHHDADTEDLSNNNFGDDYIAGGGDDDMIFAQLGHDVVQGDGSIASALAGNPVGAVRDANGGLAVQPSFEAATDGDDYIEAGGGDDLVFGNLGQDDIIGGSSELFTLVTPGQRPDGSDMLFGGAGLQIERNALGSGGGSTGSLIADHARDADHILGDNGNIYTLVDAGGAFLAFAYDSADDIGSDPAAPGDPQSRGERRIVVRAHSLLDSVPDDDAAGIGASDLIHGEDGDDVIHGMRGNDVLYGDGWDDDIYGGTGHDRIFGGSGEDGVIGDDGRILTARNGVAEPLYGLAATTEQELGPANPVIGVWVNLDGFLNKSVWLSEPTAAFDDLIYGGLGDDFLHGGGGNDAISGAEALAHLFADTRPLAPWFDANGTQQNGVLAYDPDSRKLIEFFDPILAAAQPFYDAENPRPRIEGFVLNFETFDATRRLIEDGKDRIFGGEGNDAMFGGTGKDRLFGGMGDDYLQLDDNLGTNRGLNDTSDDATRPSESGGAGDFAYGGGGLDVLIGNTGADRMFDFLGEFNSFFVPFKRFGAPTVNRLPNPGIIEFIEELGGSSGADERLPGPAGELGIVTRSDPEWGDNRGSSRDPQPGNGNGDHDTAGEIEDDRTLAPLQTAHGSTPTAPLEAVDTTRLVIEKAVNAADRLNPTAAEDADAVPVELAVGEDVVWTYLVSLAPGAETSASDVTVIDDAGTLGVSGDDFAPVRLSGDANGDDLLDPGEVWLYSSETVASHTVTLGDYVNTATARAMINDEVDEDIDVARIRGIEVPELPEIIVEKAVNAADPLNPTTAEDADTTPIELFEGEDVVWTYLVSLAPGAETSASDVTVIDDAGTLGVSGDDFAPVRLSGDANGDDLLDPGEVWLYSSETVASHTVTLGDYVNTATARAMINDEVDEDIDVARIRGIEVPELPEIIVEKAVNAADPLNPTTAEDADTTPIELFEGEDVVWTYLVSLAPGAETSASDVTVIDDAGTLGVSGDDFAPVRLSGDANGDDLLDPGEVWLYSSETVASHTVTLGDYVNTATARAMINDEVDEDIDVARIRGIEVPELPEIIVEKAVNAADPLNPTTAEDADTTPIELFEGEDVVWTYLVSLAPGAETSASDVTVIDDAGTLGVSGDDFAPVRLSGDANGDDLLDPGEVWLYSSETVASHTVTLGDYVNTATARAMINDEVDEDIDVARIRGIEVPELPEIIVEKAVNAADPLNPTTAEDADTTPIELFEGEDVVWTYLVSLAPGAETSASDVTVIDDAGTLGVSGDDFAPVRLSGDANGDDLLDPGEVWLYSSETVASHTVTLGDYVNTATARAMINDEVDEDIDVARIRGVEVPELPEIIVEKAVNAADPLNPTTAEDADTTPIELFEGEDVVWTYLVSLAPGAETSASDVTVIDDAGTLGVSGDDFAPVRLSGDANGDDLLDPGEVWLYSSETVASHTVTLGDYVNTATARAMINDEVDEDIDVARIRGVEVPELPEIIVEKAVNAADPLNPTTAEDADTTPIELFEGEDVVWTYLVSLAPGAETSASDVTVIDDAGTLGVSGDDFAPVRLSGDANGDDLLDPGEVWLYSSETVASHTVTLGDYVNTATARAMINDEVDEDIDVARIRGVEVPELPEIIVEKAVNAADPLNPTTAEDADTTPIELFEGEGVVWTYLVSLGPDAETSASEVNLFDDAGTSEDTSDDFEPVRLSGDSNGNDLLDPSEVWLYSSAPVVDHTVILGDYVNTATVSATLGGETVEDTDVARILGVEVPELPEIIVEKAVNAADPLNPTTAEDADTTPIELFDGEEVVWTYLVSLGPDAETSVSAVTLVDNAGTLGVSGDDFAPELVSGDENDNELLDPGEVWLFSSESVHSHTVTLGDYVNTATVSGLVDDVAITDSDVARITGVPLPPGIIVEKAVNASDPLNPTTAEDADVLPVVLNVGDSVVWTYTVSLEEDAEISATDATVIDDAGTPDNASDDFAPAYVSGDENGNSELDPDETWLFASDPVVIFTAETGSYANTATVTAQTELGETRDSDINRHVGVDDATAEGFTPGFWKNNADKKDAVSWPRLSDGSLVYAPDQELDSVFDLTDGLDLYGTTLEEALSLRGGDVDALMRHAVAALLNAAHRGVAYPIDAAEVVRLTDATLAAGDPALTETVKDRFVDWNERGGNMEMNGPSGKTDPDAAAMTTEKPTREGGAAQSSGTSVRSAPTASEQSSSDQGISEALSFQGIDLGPVIAQATQHEAGIAAVSTASASAKRGVMAVDPPHGGLQVFDEQSGALLDRDETRLLKSLNVNLADLLEASAFDAPAINKSAGQPATSHQAMTGRAKVVW